MVEEKRIKFYSVSDMSSGYYLTEAESIFPNWDDYIQSRDINTLLELYNVEKYIDSNMKLSHWNDNQLTEYKRKCAEIPAALGRFFSSVTDNNFEKCYSGTERNYRDDFWELICKYKVYERISEGVFRQLLSCNKHTVFETLSHKELVKTFGQAIAESLSKNEDAAECLMDCFLTRHGRDDEQLYFPAEFTQEMRNFVLTEYVERKNASINYLQLLEKVQSTKEFPISDRLKLKARRKKEQIQERLFAGSKGVHYEVEVSFKSIPDGGIEEEFDNDFFSYAYSREWIEENQDYPTLLNNFINMFGYVDSSFRSSFVSLRKEIGLMEGIAGIKGKKDYLYGFAFVLKRKASSLQMLTYRRELERINIRIEDVFKWFFEEYLKDEFGVTEFRFSPPSDGTSLAEKCKLLAIAMDGALKQYKLYCEDGFIDRELLEMSSEHVVFSEIQGKIDKKYAYPNSGEIDREMFLLFSDQAVMGYIERTKSKYCTLAQLISSERVSREDFASFQLENLDFLIKRSAVEVSGDGTILLNKERVFVLADLFNNEVICPYYYSDGLRKQVELLAEAGDLRFENTLFSKLEQDYLNFMLNRKEFSNGLDLRNKYSHDTNSLDEATQNEDYLELLKIMALIIIKINAELCLAQRIAKI